MNFLGQLDVYNIKSYDDTFKKTSKGILGTMKELNINDIQLENILILNNFTEIITWGSAWKDYPFRKLLKQKSLKIPSMLEIH